MRSSPQYSQYFVELPVHRGQPFIKALERFISTLKGKLGVLTLLQQGVTDLVESPVDRHTERIELPLNAIDALRPRLRVCHFRGHGKPTIVMAGIKHRQCRKSRRIEINKLGMERQPSVAESARVQCRPVRRFCARAMRRYPVAEGAWPCRSSDESTALYRRPLRRPGMPGCPSTCHSAPAHRQASPADRCARRARSVQA
jgi:hypothetical protein